MNISTLPDSQRMSEILPESADERWGRQLFIGQDAAVIALMRVHITLYARRVQKCPNDMVHPIQEALFSSDGRVSAFNYLALVEHFVSRVGMGLEPETDLVSTLSADLYPGNMKRADPESVRGTLAELRASRMLLVDPELGHGSDDDESMKKRLAAQLLKAVNGRFGLDLAMPMSLETVVATIQKPVFDFADLWSLLRNRDERRRVVFKFSELVTTHVALHYLFQGRIGVRPSGDSSGFTCTHSRGCMFGNR